MCSLAGHSHDVADVAHGQSGGGEGRVTRSVVVLMASAILSPVRG
jgi:hypothetical protein